MTNILDIAKYYVFTLGWSVIPVLPKDKRPAIDSWREFQLRKPTESELTTWFDKGEHNIALITGEISGVDVVDIDLTTADEHKQRMKELGIDTPLRVSTPRGGLHLYFKHTDGVRPGVNAELKVDLRADGSYVLLFPSVGSNGKQYSWELKPTTSILAALPALPPRVVEVLRKTNNGHSTFNLDEAFGVGQGSRNDTLHKASVSLLSKHPKEIAWKLVQSLNNSYDPPLPDNELETLFKSALAFVEKSPPVRPEQPTVVEARDWKNTTLEQDLEEVKRTLSERLVFSFPTGFPGLDSALGGGFKPGQSYLFFGDTNTGKSVFLLNILVFLAKNNIRCVYFDLENAYDETAERQVLVSNPTLTIDEWNNLVRNKNAGKYIDELSTQKLRVFDLTKMANRFQEITFDAVEQVMNEALKSNVQVIAIDHLHYFEPNQQNFNELATIARRINNFCAEHKVVVLMVAHTRKGLEKANKGGMVEAKRPVKDDVAGSSLIVKHTKNIIALWPTPDGGLKLCIDKTKRRIGDKTKKLVELKYSEDSLHLHQVDQYGGYVDYKSDPFAVEMEPDVPETPLDEVDEIM